ncbi:MAG: hypothetical protein ABIG84_03275 [archaeon]
MDEGELFFFHEQWGEEGDRVYLVDELDIEEKTKRKVDVLTYKSIHPLLRDIILKEEVRIYEEKRKDIPGACA